MNDVKSELTFRRWQYPTTYDSRDEAVNVKEEEVPPVMSTQHAVGLRWTCWGTRKWDCWQVHKGGVCSEFVGLEPALA